MITRRLFIGCLVAASLITAVPAGAQSVTVTGSDGHTQLIDGARIATLPRLAVPLSIHGADHVFVGPLLIDVLRAATVVPDGASRGQGLAQAVVVRASDGYAVVFGLAELDSATRADPIILADTVDGAAIAAADGPFRVVAQGDLRPARSARQVVAIEITSFATAGAGERHPASHQEPGIDDN